jgi:hypothetical protein
MTQLAAKVMFRAIGRRSVAVIGPAKNLARPPKSLDSIVNQTLTVKNDGLRLIEMA